MIGNTWRARTRIAGPLTTRGRGAPHVQAMSGGARGAALADCLAVQAARQDLAARAAIPQPPMVEVAGGEWYA